MGQKWEWGKGETAVVKPCDRERELGETSGVGGLLTSGLHRTCSTVMPMCVLAFSSKGETRNIAESFWQF